MSARGARRPTRPATVQRALEVCTEGPALSGPSRWSFALSNGKPVAGEARLEDEWLVLDLPLGDPELPLAADPRLSPGGPWSLLALNGRLSRGARFALAGDRASPSLRLRSELAVRGAGPLAERMAWAREGLLAGLVALETHDLASRESPDSEPAAGSETRDADGGAVPWAPDALAAAGWAYRTHESGELSVELDLPGLARRATLATAGRAEGEPVLSVTLLRGLPGRERARRALAWFLLRAAGGLRLVRPATRRDGDDAVLLLEVDLPAEDGEEELSRALEALSVAVRQLTREAAVLGSDGPLAATYLAVQGRDDRLAPPQPGARTIARTGMKDPARKDREKRGTKNPTRKEKEG